MGFLFLVTAISLVWMHLTIHRMLHAESPQLADAIEVPASQSSPIEHVPARTATVREESNA